MNGYELFEYLCKTVNNMADITAAHLHEDGLIRIEATMPEGPKITIEGVASNEA